MSIRDTFDLSIKKAQTGETKANKFYELGNRRYEKYIDNETWDAFVKEMRTNYSQAYKEYSQGSGDELGIKKILRRPPKMASYGSSSRMIYLLSRDIPNFCFEKKLPTTVGGIANMDGYLICNNTHFYIEAKCGEPYSLSLKSKKLYKIERKYEALYRYLDQDTNIDFNCEITIIDDIDMVVRFFANGEEITRFDIKQMISHLLGVATENLKFLAEEKTRFLYLLYDPRQLEIIDSKHQTEIFSIYDIEISECDRIPFDDLYNSIVQYLYKYEGICSTSESIVKKISGNFAFMRCDQISYRNLLEC